MTKKGISTMIAALLLMILVMGVSGAFTLWMTDSSDILEDMVGNQSNKSSSSREGGFAVVGVDYTSKQLTIENTGKIKIGTDQFVFYFNDTSQNYLPDKTEIFPGETTIISFPGFPGNLEPYRILITGPYGLRDEIYPVS